MKVRILETKEAKEIHDELGSRVQYGDIGGYSVFITAEFGDSGLEKYYNITKKQAEDIIALWLKNNGRT